MAQTPLLRQSPLTGRWYVVTKYRLTDGGNIDAQEKHDVTDQIVAIQAGGE